MFKYFFMICVQVFLAELFVIPSSAHAYLDPGTSTFLLQLMSAALISVLAFWTKIKSVIKGFLSKKND